MRPLNKKIYKSNETPPQYYAEYEESRKHVACDFVKQCIGFVEQDQIITFICFECEFNSELGTEFYHHISTMHPHTRKMREEFCYTCTDTMDIHGEWVHLIEVHIQPLMNQLYEAEHMEYIIYVQNHSVEE